MPNRLLPPACWSTAKQRIRHSPGFGIAAQIMRRELVYANLRGELFNYVPDELLGNPFAPDLPSATHATEEATAFDSSSVHPH